jgi:FkbM family methyltransferase
MIRKLMRFFICNTSIKGRHRLANRVGHILAPKNIEEINIDGIYLPIDHSIEMYRYVYYGVYEEFFVRLLKRIIRPGDLVIEPGVNIGYITAILSKLVGVNGKIIALEPSKICFKKISNYLSKSNIKLLNKALHDKTGVAYFTDKTKVITHGYSTLSEFTSIEDGDAEYLIPTTTVDDLMIEFSLKHIRLLKLDIEEAELMAINGSSLALSQKRIDFILVETTFQEVYNKINSEIFEKLEGYGYKPYLMGRNELNSVNLRTLNNTRHDIIWSHLNDLK